jgi:hypothetical protein
MNPVEKNARAILAKLHDWRGETFRVEGNLLLSATGLTVTEIGNAGHFPYFRAMSPRT